MPIEKFPILPKVEDTISVWKRKLEYLFENLDDDNITSTTLTLGANQVKASNIDFGTGVDQVDASDIPILDASSYYSGSDVENALQQLGSTLLNPFFPVGKFGNSSDYSQFEADGTLKFNGNATVYRDELQSLLLQNYVAPTADITINSSEGTVEFKQACNLGDYVIMNVQINHDYKFLSALCPHLHWWQTSSNMPNWLIQYRWQYNGIAVSTSWTNAKWSSNAVPYTAGTINQITDFGDIIPSTNYSLSSILQLRLFRDGDNDSSAFGSTDLVTGTVSALNFDVHIEIDTLGSRQEYIK